MYIYIYIILTDYNNNNMPWNVLEQITTPLPGLPYGGGHNKV